MICHSVMKHCKPWKYYGIITAMNWYLHSLLVIAILVIVVVASSMLARGDNKIKEMFQTSNLISMGEQHKL